MTGRHFVDNVRRARSICQLCLGFNFSRTARCIPDPKFPAGMSIANMDFYVVGIGPTFTRFD